MNLNWGHFGSSCKFLNMFIYIIPSFCKSSEQSLEKILWANHIRTLIWGKGAPFRTQSGLSQNIHYWKYNFLFVTRYPGKFEKILWAKFYEQSLNLGPNIFFKFSLLQLYLPYRALSSCEIWKNPFQQIILGDFCYIIHNVSTSA